MNEQQFTQLLGGIDPALIARAEAPVPTAIDTHTANLRVAHHNYGIFVERFFAFFEYEVRNNRLCVARYALKVLRNTLAEREFAIRRG